jgi:hypothetical protein
VAFRASQVLVFMFARSHTDLLLPALERSLADVNWRIRDSGVRLLGDLLHRLAGAKSAINYDAEDDNGDEAAASASADVREAIEAALGKAVHDRVLAGLYIVRADTMSQVRQTAWRVWKSVISNSPRTLRDVLPALMDLILLALAATNLDRQTAAGRTLGELVGKMGEAVLPVIVPILNRTLASRSPHARQGVGLGLGEVLRSANKAHIGAYMADLIPAIQRALCDPVVEVRRAAAVAFATLLKNTGQRAIEEIVPPLIERLLSQGQIDGGRAVFGDDQDDDDQEDDADSAEEKDNDKPPSGMETDDEEDDADESDEDDEDDEDEEDDDDEDEDEDEDDEEDADEAGEPQWLEGVRQVLEMAADRVLPHLVPRLSSPVDVFRARCLAALAPSFGDELHGYLPELLKALVRAVADAATDRQDAQQVPLLSLSKFNNSPMLTCFHADMTCRFWTRPNSWCWRA